VPGLGSHTQAGLGAVQADASSAPLLTILLALVVLAVGGYIGVRSWRSPRRAAGAGAPADPPQLPPPSA
jgi:hypothetical protein